MRRWIEKGSVREDYNWQNLLDPLYSHFYNPLTNKSGVGDWVPSAYEWADMLNNKWSWKSARDYFYKGLTLTVKDERGEALAKAFRALGHVIHLVQDMAVPAHTRGDLHANDPYESYTKNNKQSLIYNAVQFTGTTNSVTSGAPRQLWDTDVYTETSLPIGTVIGLAEYSSANFFSKHTIFKGMPHPMHEDTNCYKINELTPVEITNEKGEKDLRIYISKDKGEQVKNLASFSLLEYDVEGKLAKYGYAISEVCKKTPFLLDEKTHKDYASLLIPRAVGYSAGLLDYFFRGRIDMEPDPNSQGQYIIKNLSNEQMNGTFSLYYDDIYDSRRLIASFLLSIEANDEGTVSFSLPSEPKPKNEGEYILVFRGKLGNEDGAVVGGIVKLKCGCDVSLTIINEDGTPALDTITRGSSRDYKATGCGDCPVTWSLSATDGSAVGNSTITQDGVLTAGSTACGTLGVTANCRACGTSDTQDVRVTDAGGWVQVASCSQNNFSGCFSTDGWMEETLSGRYKHLVEYHRAHCSTSPGVCEYCRSNCESYPKPCGGGCSECYGCLTGGYPNYCFHYILWTGDFVWVCP
ncbi:MAG: hypothetical protein HY805_01165 [Nitrospirae bacterium]|nr:hypothetical protein [Nitrospirota bacterium]